MWGRFFLLRNSFAALLFILYTEPDPVVIKAKAYMNFHECVRCCIKFLRLSWKIGRSGQRLETS